MESVESTEERRMAVRVADIEVVRLGMTTPTEALRLPSMRDAGFSVFFAIVRTGETHTSGNIPRFPVVEQTP